MNEDKMMKTFLLALSVSIAISVYLFLFDISVLISMRNIFVLFMIVSIILGIIVAVYQRLSSLCPLNKQKGNTND